MIINKKYFLTEIKEKKKWWEEQKQLTRILIRLFEALKSDCLQGVFAYQGTKPTNSPCNTVVPHPYNALLIMCKPRQQALLFASLLKYSVPSKLSAPKNFSFYLAICHVHFSFHFNSPSFSPCYDSWEIFLKNYKGRRWNLSTFIPVSFILKIQKTLHRIWAYIINTSYLLHEV